jgi:hypothetical protein
MKRRRKTYEDVEWRGRGRGDKEVDKLRRGEDFRIMS